MIERMSRRGLSRGVNAYLRKFEYSNATAKIFWNTIAAASLRGQQIMPTFVTSRRAAGRHHVALRRAARGAGARARREGSRAA